MGYVQATTCIDVQTVPSGSPATELSIRLLSAGLRSLSLEKAVPFIAASSRLACSTARWIIVLSVTLSGAHPQLQTTKFPRSLPTDFVAAPPFPCQHICTIVHEQSGMVLDPGSGTSI